MPYFLVGGESVYDRLREPKFHVLVFEDEDASSQASENSRTAQTVAAGADTNIVDFQNIPLGKQASEAFGADGPFTVLLRPDNYVGCISAGTSAGGLESYLKEFIGHAGGV